MTAQDDKEFLDQAYQRPRLCLDCEERFTLGEMLPGKNWLSPMRCPYCKSENCTRSGPTLQ